MRHLKSYTKLFENHQSIHDICKKYGITNYTINDDGSIDVNGDVYLSYRELTKIPLKFRNVSGYFACFNNKLKSLEGAPESVGGNFNCSDNQLVSLDGSPQSVGGNFYCKRNQLTSLEGAPESVGGNFNCQDNQLSSLDGAPQSVGRGFYCQRNQLMTLEGAPQSVGGDFYCYYNQLTTLEGAPQSVGGYFNCASNLIFEIWKLFGDYSKIELFNDYDALREIDGKPHVVLDRLNQFLKDIGKGPVKKVDGWINI